MSYPLHTLWGHHQPLTHMVCSHIVYTSGVSSRLSRTLAADLMIWTEYPLIPRSLARCSSYLLMLSHPVTVLAWWKRQEATPLFIYRKWCESTVGTGLCVRAFWTHLCWLYHPLSLLGESVQKGESPILLRLQGELDGGMQAVQVVQEWTHMLPFQLNKGVTNVSPPDPCNWCSWCSPECQVLKHLHVDVI